MTTRRIRLFYSYTHEDEQLRKRLEEHLSPLVQQGLIEDWYDRKISPGEEREQEISSSLESADIILLLITPRYLASNDCSDECKRALARHQEGKARVIPILMRTAAWHVNKSLAKLEALPRDHRAVTSRGDKQDEVLSAIAQDIYTVVNKLRESQQEDTAVAGNHQPSAAQKKPWNVPYRRNPFFTGREQALALLRERLVGKRTAALPQPQAISGLGGVGKTQIAVEYAFRHREEYSAVFWASAATLESLQGDFVKIASLLRLPEKDAREQALTIEAVRRWLARERDWLLILDNADDLLPDIRPFLPDTSQTNGHILITTRDPAAGNLAEPLEVTQMERTEGTQLLLRRARKLAQATDEDRAGASAIVDLLGALPLALDQAGAYIEEHRCSLADYQALYRQRRKELLGWLGRFPPDYPRVVATTWDLSFQQIKAASPASAELLRLCAFLDPDAIPEELLSEGAPELGPILSPVAADPFKLNEAIQTLLRYSLLRRNPTTKTLTIHRLVQAVLLDRMDKKTHRRWAERTIRALNSTFPQEAENYRNWPLCQRLLPHVQSCAALDDQDSLYSADANRLFHRTGMYLQKRALYEQAEIIFKRALLIGEKVDGPGDPSTGATLNELATLYQNWGKYEQAEKLYRRALDIKEKALGPEHPEVAITLHELARLYQNKRIPDQAEELYRRALAIYEKSLEPEHLDTAITLQALATLYQDWDKNKHRQAEKLYLRALEIYRQAGRLEDPDAGGTLLHELARLYQSQGRSEEAESLWLRALDIIEKSFGPEHPVTAITLGALGFFYAEQGKDERAEDYYRRALAVLERVLGDEHPETTITLNNYARFLRTVGRDEEAAEMEGRIKRG